jgi:hypothetical protein
VLRDDIAQRVEVGPQAGCPLVLREPHFFAGHGRARQEEEQKP